ncbi:MAG: hypothetical protein EOP49_20855 [Sphingobacteriales bacterium]|nr:MAG: hypothetical protein EOP49_20855 [Sphingobacteriales bacterium]
MGNTGIPFFITAKSRYFAPMNEPLKTILEILKYTVPAIVVLIACAVIVKRFLVTEVKEKQLKLLEDNQETTVRLRLQAYERLVLFIERIHPRQLVPRVYMSGMNVAELHAALTYTIRTEFEHNLSQQIYVSKPVWNTVRGVKEQELNMINTITQQLNPEAPGKELHTRIVDYVMTMEGELPTDVALELINEEAKKVLTYGSQG